MVGRGRSPGLDDGSKLFDGVAMLLELIVEITDLMILMLFMTVLFQSICHHTSASVSTAAIGDESIPVVFHIALRFQRLSCDDEYPS